MLENLGVLVQAAVKHLESAVQEENAEARQSLEVLDGQVSKVTNALAMEQALTSACNIQKSTVEERMGGLIDQVEMMHAKWKEEQDARMLRQHEVYQKSDELRQTRVQLIEANAASRCFASCPQVPGWHAQASCASSGCRCWHGVRGLASVLGMNSILIIQIQ